MKPKDSLSSREYRRLLQLAHAKGLSEDQAVVEALTEWISKNERAKAKKLVVESQ